MFVLNTEEGRMSTHLSKFRSAVVLVVVLGLLMLVVAPAAAVSVDLDDLWVWLVRCFVAMAGGHVDW